MKLSTLFLAIALAATPACDLFLGRTKVAQGQLYQSGEPKYDPYFEQVHREQVVAASWPDEAKASRRSIVGALNLAPNASTSTIISATREKKGDGNVGRAVDETAAAEAERARRLQQFADQLEKLSKQGEELKERAGEDRKNMGADKADEKKVQKRDEIKREVGAAVDVTSSLARDARKSAREAEEFAENLKHAFEGKEDQPRAKKDDRRAEEKKPEPKAEERKPEEKKPEEKKPEEKKPEERRPARPAKPAEPAKPPDVATKKPGPAATSKPEEVFNP